MIQRPMVNRKLTIAVLLGAAVLVGLIAILGVRQAKDLYASIRHQFNEEQLVIARNIANTTERTLRTIQNELRILASALESADTQAPHRFEDLVQQCFLRVHELGVRQIEQLDGTGKVLTRFLPRQSSVTAPVPDGPISPPAPRQSGNTEFDISTPEKTPMGVRITIDTPVARGRTWVRFQVNLTWLLNPILKEIRSGTTGYAWLIDETGRFLFHPNADFIGKSAFTAREEKDPQLSYALINFIQKEKMLTGEASHGWYFTGWHRGLTGQIKKLIAYCPVTIVEAPRRNWSVAVVAPETEIDGLVKDAFKDLLVMHLVMTMIIVLGAGVVVFFEIRWSRTLEKKVIERTEALKRSEEQYRSLVESAEDFIYSFDAQGRFLSMNSFTAGFFGGRPDQFVGRPLSEMFPEAVAEAQLKRSRTVFRHGKSVRDEFELRTDDPPTWINANFMPLRNTEGRVQAVLCIARDITEQKKLEHQLIHAEKLASIGTLAAGVAHEVNNPLGVILGFCDLLLDKTEKGTQAYEDLKTIERQGLHCKEVVENLLSFSRSGGDLQETAELNETLKEILHIVRHTLEMKKIHITTAFSLKVQRVRGDRRQLQQVFLNLINNAAAAMKKGGTLSIRTFLEKDRHRAVAEFQDTGEGIPQRDVDRIFEPFFTTKPEGEGTGLGLFISYGIVTNYGGSIECRSRQAGTGDERVGTTFWVRLPIHVSLSR